MNPIVYIYNILFAQPLTNLLVVFYKLFISLGLPGAFGFAIIGLTAFIRLVLQPFFHKQMETTHKMQELKPHLDALHKKHGHDKATLQKEQLKLYQEAGINPAQGCLLMLIQLPIFIALYNVLNLFLSNGDFKKAIAAINGLVYTPALRLTRIDPSFFGINLVITPQQAGLGPYLLVPIVTGALQYFQASTMTPPAPTLPEKAGDKPAGDDFQRAMNMQMKFIFPVLIAWISYSLPVGLALYWNIFSLFSIYQQQKVKKMLAVKKA